MIPELAFVDTKWHTASEKQLFVKRLIAFIERGYPEKQFTNKLYSHLNQMFGHIAHFDKQGFYNVWFRTIPGRVAFLENISCWISVGDPSFVWSDVEEYLGEWVNKSGLIEEARNAHAHEIELRERQLLAELSRKYSTA